jgi:hypothetical protein
MTNLTRISDLVLTEDFFKNYRIEARPAPIDLEWVLYVNGIFNTERESQHGAYALCKTLEGRVKICPIFSPSESPTLDLFKRGGVDPGPLGEALFPPINAIQSVYHWRETSDYTNFEIRRLKDKVQWNSLALDAMGDPGKIYLVAFSRGSSVVYHAVKDLTQQQKDRLVIVFCGPTMDIPNSLGLFFTKNFITYNDFASLHFHPGITMYPEIYEKKANIELLGPSEGLSGLLFRLTTGHRFVNELYQKAIKDTVLPFLEEDEKWRADQDAKARRTYEFPFTIGGAEWHVNQLNARNSLFLHPQNPLLQFDNTTYWQTSAYPGNQPPKLQESRVLFVETPKSNASLENIDLQGVDGSFEGQLLGYDDLIKTSKTHYLWPGGSRPPFFNPTSNSPGFLRPMEITGPSNTSALLGASLVLDFGGAGASFFIGASALVLPVAAVVAAVTGVMMIHNHLKQNEIKHFAERIQGFTKRSSKQLDAVVAADQKLRDLMEHPPESLDQYPKYLKAIDSAISARYYAASVAFKDADKLFNHTEEHYLNRKRHDGIIKSRERAFLFNQIHPQAAINLEFIKEIRENKNKDRETCLKGADAYMCVLTYDVELDAFDKFSNTIFDSKTTQEERTEAFERLQSLSPKLCQHYENICNLPENLRPPDLTDLKAFQDSINTNQKYVKFFMSPIEEASAELQSLKNEKPDEYLKLGLFFHRRLIEQKDFAADAEHIAEWLDLTDQNTPLQELLEMGYGYLQAFPSALNANPAKVLAAFNNCFENRQDLKPEDHESMMKQKGLFYFYANDYSPEAGLTYKACVDLFTEEQIRDLMQSRFLDTQFWSRSNDQNLTELQGLLKENTSEYLHYSKLHHRKLCHEEKFTEALSFAIEYFKSLPQDAVWKDVLDLVQANMQVLSHGSGLSLAEFRDLYIKALKARPDLQLTGERMAPDEERPLNDPELAKLAQAKLHLPDRDHSLEAEDCYEKCEDFLPEGKDKTMMKGIVRSLKNEWSKAKELLEDLPPGSEEARAVRQYVSASEQRTYQFGLELFSYLYYNHIAPRGKAAFLQEAGIGSVVFNSMDAAVQVALNPIASEWYLPKLNSFPEELEQVTQPLGMVSKGYFGLQLLNGLLLKNAIDLFSSNPEQKREWHNALTTPLSVALEGGGIASRIYSLIKSELRTPYSYANIGLLVSQMALNIDALSGHNILDHQYSRPMLQSAVKVQSITLPITIVIGNTAAIRACGMFVANRLPSSLSSLLIRTGLIAAKIIPAASVVLTVGSVIYGVADYYESKAETTMEEAQRLFSKGKRKESRQILKEAKSWSFGDSAAVEYYASCMAFIESIPLLGANPVSKQRLSEFMPKVDKALKALKSVSNYEQTYLSLLIHKVIAHLIVEEYKPVDKILKDPNTVTDVHEQVAIFLIRRSESLAKEVSYVEAKTYLQMMLQQFSTLAYQSILQQYKNYMHVRAANPILKSGDPEAIALTLKTIDDVLNRIRGNLFSELRENLLCDKICVYYETDKYAEANALLGQVESLIHTKVALYLIDHAKTLSAKPVKNLSSLRHKGLVEKHKSYISASEDSQFEKKNSVLEELVKSPISTVVEFTQLYIDLQLESINPHFDKPQYLDQRKFGAMDTVLRQLDSQITKAKKRHVDFSSTLDQIKAEIHNHLALCLIKQAEDLCANERFDTAQDNLQTAFYQFQHAQLMGKYEEYLSQQSLSKMTPKTTTHRIHTIDNVIAHLEAGESKMIISDFLPLYAKLVSAKICCYLVEKNYQSADEILVQTKRKISEMKENDGNIAALFHAEKLVHHNVASFLIKEGDTLKKEGKVHQAEQQLFTASLYLPNFNCTRLINEYCNYVSMPLLTHDLSEEIREYRMSRIDALLTEVNTFDTHEFNGIPFLQLYLDLQVEKICLDLHNIQFSAVNTALSSITTKLDKHYNASIINDIESKIHNIISLYLIAKAETLCEKKSHSSAVQLLRDACIDVKFFKRIGLLDKYVNYIEHRQLVDESPENEIEVCLRKIDSLLEELKKTGVRDEPTETKGSNSAPVFSELCINLQSEKNRLTEQLDQKKTKRFAKYIDNDQFLEAKHVWECISSPKLRADLQELLVETLVATAPTPTAGDRLHRVLAHFDCKQHQKIQEYADLLAKTNNMMRG